MPRNQKLPVHQVNPLNFCIVANRVVDVETGEEDEVTLESFKTKLFEFCKESKEWIEKGLGTLKLNSCTVNESYSRISTPNYIGLSIKKTLLVMRADGVPRVLLNFRVYPELKVDLAQPKNVRLAILEEGRVRQILLRVQNGSLY